MTKAWESVREDVIRLIRAGESLEQVRARLSTERKFDASVRSYRKKLKQWKLTRTGQFEIQGSNATSSSDAASSIPSISLTSEVDVVDGDRLPPGSGTDSISRRNSVATNSLTTYEQLPSPVSAYAVSPSTRALSPDHRSTLRPPEAKHRGSSQQEATFKSLEDAENGPTMFDILRRLKSQFASGTDTILHWAVAQTNFWVVDCILDFMISQKISVDIIDSQGLTALETAIGHGRKENVESLLRARADVNRRHKDAGMPLHRAASSGHSAIICRVLLSHGAEVNEVQHTEGTYQPTPLRILVDRALSMKRGQDKDDISAMIEVVLEYGGLMSHGEDPYDHERDILNFLDWWTRLGVPEEGRHSRGFYLGHFFRAECSPLCWFPARVCAECHSMASFVFSHTKARLGHLLIQSSDMEKFGLQLAQRIIKPCSNRGKQKEGTLSELLDTLLKKSAEQSKKSEREWQRSEWDHQLVFLVLESSPIDEKLPLLSTLLKQKTVLDSDRRRVFDGLAALDDQLRLPAAELLLDPDVGLLQKEYYDNFMRGYLAICEQSPHTERAELRPRFEVQALQDLDINADSMTANHRRNILQSVIHVLTRFQITETAASVPEFARIEAFRLRDAYGLVTLTMTSRPIETSLPFDAEMAALWKLQGSERSEGVTLSPASSNGRNTNERGMKRRSTTKSIEMGDANGHTAAND